MCHVSDFSVPEFTVPNYRETQSMIVYGLPSTITKNEKNG
jgi:hypothetical protein